MKRLVGLLLAALLLAGAPLSAWAQWWEAADNIVINGLFMSSFTNGNLSRTDVGTYTVWIRTAANPVRENALEDARAYWTKSAPSLGSYANWDHNLELIEFDTARQRYRRLSDAFYNADGSVIYSSDPQDAPWQYIVPDSVMGAVFAKVKAAIQRKETARN